MEGSEQVCTDQTNQDVRETVNATEDNDDLFQDGGQKEIDHVEEGGEWSTGSEQKRNGDDRTQETEQKEKGQTLIDQKMSDHTQNEILEPLEMMGGDEKGSEQNSASTENGENLSLPEQTEQDIEDENREPNLLEHFEQKTERSEISLEERALGVYEDEDDSDLDEAVADLDLEIEPEIIGEELVDSILRKETTKSASTRKCRIESALSSIDETEELTAPSVADERGITLDDKRPATCGTELPLSRAKLNTPASYSMYTDVTAELRNLERGDSRDTTRTQETREAVFRRALNLMSNRCTSGAPETDVMPSALMMHDDEETFGAKQPQYFYIHQRRPSPMAPLKAWRGYHGNVYFEPISIKSVNNVKVNNQSANEPDTQLVRYDPRVGITNQNARPMSTPSSRPNTRQLMRSSFSRRSQRQNAVLDRRSVMTQFNPQFQSDLRMIDSQQDTGSLAMRPPSTSSKEAKQQATSREKIVRGSVVQRIREQKQSARNKPQFTISGDKFSPSYTMSPLLRAQTQYSYSNTRMTMNSPDPHHTVYDHLPPLDQIRASLRHMDHIDSMSEPSYSKPTPHGRKVTLTDDLKPFIKYSPDIRAKYMRQLQYLRT